ncbi:hypothetical protein [Streptomyces californicus]|uniref:hypothetical protein n=1 Tax=Streptomyces californicus TaxID=67351 RepID=UPI00369D311C
MFKQGFRHRRTVGAVVGGVLFTALAAGHTQALDWGPLTASYDGTKRSSGYGSFTIAGSTYAQNKVYTKDLAADGNTVYQTTTWQWYEAGGCGPGYSRSTPEHSRSGYQVNYLRQQLESSSEKVRGSHTVCVQLGFPVADRCSATALTTLSY